MFYSVETFLQRREHLNINFTDNLLLKGFKLFSQWAGMLKAEYFIRSAKEP